MSDTFRLASDMACFAICMVNYKGMFEFLRFAKGKAFTLCLVGILINIAGMISSAYGFFKHL